MPALVASLGVPDTLGTADIWGHGTKVAGIAAFGDVRECAERRAFDSPVRIISVKVVNDQGQFDDVATIPDQMHTAIRELHGRGCRIINISLGDMHRIPYDGGRVSSWAATLDTLARELDIVIVLSAGNCAKGDRAPWGPQAEGIRRPISLSHIGHQSYRRTCDCGNRAHGRKPSACKRASCPT